MSASFGVWPRYVATTYYGNFTIISLRLKAIRRAVQTSDVHSDAQWLNPLRRRAVSVTEKLKLRKGQIGEVEKSEQHTVILYN